MRKHNHFATCNTLIDYSATAADSTKRERIRHSVSPDGRTQMSGPKQPRLNLIGLQIQRPVSRTRRGRRRDVPDGTMWVPSAESTPWEIRKDKQLFFFNNSDKTLLKKAKKKRERDGVELIDSKRFRRYLNKSQYVGLTCVQSQTIKNF